DRFLLSRHLDQRLLPPFPTRRSSDLARAGCSRLVPGPRRRGLALDIIDAAAREHRERSQIADGLRLAPRVEVRVLVGAEQQEDGDRKSTRLNSSHVKNSYAVFCLKKK